jgi:hypothetical protein
MVGKKSAETNAPWTNSGSPGAVRVTREKPLSRGEELDRWMIQRMLWEGRVQGEIARELGVSQPAACKRKRLVLDKLRRFLTISRPRNKSRL